MLGVGRKISCKRQETFKLITHDVWNEVITFSHHSSGFEHVSEPCDGRRARHTHTQNHTHTSLLCEDVSPRGLWRTLSAARSKWLAMRLLHVLRRAFYDHSLIIHVTYLLSTHTHSQSPLSHTHLQHIALLRKHMWVDPESSSWALCDKWASAGIAAVVVVGENTAFVNESSENSVLNVF